MVRADVVVPDIDAYSFMGGLFKREAGKVTALASLLGRKSLVIFRPMVDGWNRLSERLDRKKSVAL